MHMEQPVIRLDQVTKAYSAKSIALQDVSLRIHKGEFVFVVGSSGSGKSTLVRLLLKELEPTSGKIVVNGQALGTMKRRQVPLYRRTLGVVFQDFRLLKDRDIYENVAFAQRAVGYPKYKIKKQVPAILEEVGLKEKLSAKPGELSGGEQQRVALARALVNKPSVLLADEPTGNLDPKNSWEIMQLLEDINKKGTTVLVVTHNREIVDAMQKRVITLEQGVLLHDKLKGGYSYD